MAKRFYADVVMNGEPANLAIRASSEKEARLKLQTLPEYRKVTEIMEVSPNPPRELEKRHNFSNGNMVQLRKRSVSLYTGGAIR